MKSSEITIPLEQNIKLQGILNIPTVPHSLVIFSHGSGSSRFSVRNRFVAEILNKANIATLLIDLLTEEEDTIYENRFDIELLTHRLVELTSYIFQQKEFQNLELGYFGASTGAASALKAAARLDGIVNAVVSRGGRPDLAMDSLPKVTAATLLIVGSLDTDVITLNEQAFEKIQSKKEMVIIEGASHLFEEPGKLIEVAALARDWFDKHLYHPAPKLKHSIN